MIVARSAAKKLLRGPVYRLSGSITVRAIRRRERLEKQAKISDRVGDDGANLRELVTTSERVV